MRELDEDARAVAGADVSALGATMLEVVERLQRLRHHVVARDVVQARDHGHAARVVLVARVVEAVGLWRHAVVQLRVPGAAGEPESEANMIGRPMPEREGLGPADGDAGGVFVANANVVDMRGARARPTVRDGDPATYPHQGESPDPAPARCDRPPPHQRRDAHWASRRRYAGATAGYQDRSRAYSLPRGSWERGSASATGGDR
jgi:hypothetical protein